MQNGKRVKMLQFFRDILLSIGGGSVVLVGMLTIFKGLFVNFFTNVIDSSFEKSLEKYRNKITRSNKAYEILLDREMSFYEKVDPIFAELIPLVQDLLFYLRYNEDVDREKECEDYREHLKKYIQLINILKNKILLHQSYIPDSVFKSSSEVVSEMQKSLDYWYKMAKLLFAEKYDDIDYDKGKNIVDDLLKLISLTEQVVKHQLKEMSELK